MKYLLGKSLLLIILPVILFAGSIIGQDVIPRPEGKQQLVYDYAGFLDKSQDQELNQMLEEFALETSNQILFLTVKTLNGLEPYAYAEQVLSTWGIGQKDLNNGIVFLVKPKTRINRLIARNMRVECLKYMRSVAGPIDAPTKIQPTTR